MLISLIIVCHFTVVGCAAYACNGYEAALSSRLCGETVSRVQIFERLPKPSVECKGATRALRCFGQISAALGALIEFWRESAVAVSVHALFIFYYTQIGSGVGATVLR